MACKKWGCPFVRTGPYRKHGFCCQACKRGERHHTRHCSGFRCGEFRAAPASLWSTGYDWSAGEDVASDRLRLQCCGRYGDRVRVQCFDVPSAWQRGVVHPVKYVLDLLGEFEMTVDHPEVWTSWVKFSEAVDHVQVRGRLCIRAVKRDWIFDGRRQINGPRCVDLKSVNGAHHSYRMGAVTGSNRAVQARLVSQAATAVALTEAIQLIELHDLADLAFVCDGATHRSVGCCFLLAAMAYPSATVGLTTPRTVEAAQWLCLY